MKLYNHPVAPNPRRVRVFAAEKEINLALEDIDLLGGQNRTPQFLAINPSGGVPVLALDDGSYLPESVAICRYLEGLEPEPNLFRTRPQRAGANRDVAPADGAGTVVLPGRTHGGQYPSDVQRCFPPIPGLWRSAARGGAGAAKADGPRVGVGEFVAGDWFTIADITALAAIDVAAPMANIHMDPALANLTRWHQAVSRRPSAKA